MNKSVSIKLAAIIFLCIIWVIFIPGYVAFKQKVFYGWMFKDKISDSIVTSRIKTDNVQRQYHNNILVADSSNTNKTVTFAGFAENGLNYVWLESYIILCIYAFLLYYSFSKKLLNSHVFLLTLFIIFLFHSSTWIRNSGEFGKYGRTIYSYVNYDIDKASFWLQELRGYFFSFLMAVFWYQFELKRRESYTMTIRFAKNLSVSNFIELTKNTKISFTNWQRDILISILLFLPWTWFYWRNIYYHGDSRYVFPAITFHSFWIISIILISRPFLIVNFSFWKLKMKLLLGLIENKENDKLVTFVENLEPLPKGQFLITAATTLFSLVSPFLQFVFKK